MAKPCDWCGGMPKKHKEFFQGKIFCHPNHRIYWTKFSHPNAFGELTKEELATKDSNVDIEIQEDAGPGVGYTTSASIGR